MEAGAGKVPCRGARVNIGDMDEMVSAKELVFSCFWFNFMTWKEACKLVLTLFIISLEVLCLSFKSMASFLINNVHLIQRLLWLDYVNSSHQTCTEQEI